MEKLSTGIEGLDKILEGGFPIGYNFVIEGDISTEKSILVNQLINSHLELGGTVLYVVTNRDPENILEEAGQFGWDFNKFTLGNKISYFNCYGYRAGVKGAYALNDLLNLSISIDKKVSSLKQVGNVMQVLVHSDVCRLLLPLVRRLPALFS